MSTETPANYLDPKTLEQIRRLDVRARLVVEGFITGQHRSPYNGFAVEFAAHREYVPGDDLRHIDWKVWSKTDRLYIKEYEEETNLDCHLILDCSHSMDYGRESGWSKFDHASTIAACFGHLMQQQQDAVGLELFSNAVDLVLKPSTSPSHIRSLMHHLQQAEPAKQSDVDGVFTQLAAQLKRRGLVVLISDLFYSDQQLSAGLEAFRLRGQEVVLFHVMHGDELTFPFDENTLFKGLEVDQQVLVEPRGLKASYLEAVEAFLSRVKRIATSVGVDHVLVDTSKSLGATLSSYLAFRQKVRRKRR
jgi:uncharacterized protein (DUF58 family)